MTRRYTSVMEIHCPWLLRYMVVISIVQSTQNRAVIGRMVDVGEGGARER